MNKNEFYEQYAKNSKMTLNRLKKILVARPCDCDYDGCQGWQMCSIELEETKKCLGIE